jgi:hypothetical protein
VAIAEDALVKKLEMQGNPRGASDNGALDNGGRAANVVD